MGQSIRAYRRNFLKEITFKNKIINATKWAALTEIAVKLVTPITSMVLARILTPNAFGVVATVTMIVSFAEMFTDAGFQKFLIQHEFISEDEKIKYTNVAFWTNFLVSIVLWLVIIAFSDNIASSVGTPGMGKVISIASFQILLTSFSSIQMALYRRDFEFKTLFLVRIVSVFIPFIVTIPLALLGLSYWALIIGTTTMQLSNAIILTVKSKWKPKFFFNTKILEEMFSFSVWSLIEAISIWFTIWIDAFIIGYSLNQYYLGLYKTSTSIVNTIMALIIGSTTPILFSTLSRLQHDELYFNNMFLKFQRIISIIVFPLGVGVFLYSDVATQILLGDQWTEASELIGIWALTSSFVIIFGNYFSEFYRAKGNPKLSFVAQLLHLIVLVPACIISSKYGFLTLVYTRSLIRLQFIIVHFFIMKFVIGFSVSKLIINVYPTAISALAMGIFGYFLKQYNSDILWTVFSIIMCIVFYFGVLFVFPQIRKEMHEVTKRFF